MAPPRVLPSSLPHSILWVGTVEPNLHSHDIIIHKVHTQAHLLPPALVPGLAVHQEVVPQDHPDHCDQDQDPMMGLVPAPVCVQRLVDLRGPLAPVLHPLKLYQCMTMMRILLHTVKRMCHTQMTK